MIKIGQASRDERMKYSGGSAGDQDGKEVAVRDWYNRPWNKILRAKDPAKAEKIAAAMEAACKNENIGYDQSQRYTLYDLCRYNGWDIAAVKTPCETDCSALVAVCVNAAGIRVPGSIYTGNQAAALLRTGEFELLDTPKYLTTDEFLKRGDILLYEFHHTAIALQDGPRAATEVKQGIEFTPGWNKTERGEWWYADTTKSFISGRWALIDGKWYVFDQKGTMITGWFRTMEDWYYLNPENGSMLSGQWIQVEDKWYYLQRSGLLAREAYVRERDQLCWVNKDGIWDGTYVDRRDKTYEIVE